MRAFKLSILFSICAAIVIPLSILIADDPPPTTTITTSYGSTYTIRNIGESKDEFTDHEGRLTVERIDKIELLAKVGVIQKGVNKDISGLRDAAQGVGITVVAGNRPDVAAIMALAKQILKMLEEGQDFEIYLKFIDKWAEIEANNQDIANAFSDRDKFFELYKAWWIYENGSNNPVPTKHEKQTLKQLQAGIPPIGVRCGGSCNAWWYNGSDYFMDGDTWSVTDPQTGVGGTSASLKDMSSLATNHKTTCAGCGVGYWTCSSLDSAKHQKVYCNKDIIQTYQSSLTTTKLGKCGESYYRCLPTDGVHQYVFRSDKGNVKIKSLHSGAKKSPLSSSIYGPNGTGLPSTASTVSDITYACGVHSGSPGHADSHKWVYENCPSSHAHYACDGSDHSTTYCYKTNENGTCTVGSYYACEDHTCNFPESSTPSPETEPQTDPEPTLVSCYRAGCSGMVSSSRDHLFTCAKGHNYLDGCTDLSGRWYHSHSTHTETTCTRCSVSFYPCEKKMECTNGKRHAP